MSDIARNEPYLVVSALGCEVVVSQVEAAGIRRDRIVMLGFSQGACLTTEFAIRNASRFGGFVAFSGGAIGPRNQMGRDQVDSTARRSSSAAVTSIRTYPNRA
jgi:predicted esterase